MTNFGSPQRFSMRFRLGLIGGCIKSVNVSPFKHSRALLEVHFGVFILVEDPWPSSKNQVGGTFPYRTTGCLWCDQGQVDFHKDQSFLVNVFSSAMGSSLASVHKPQLFSPCCGCWDNCTRLLQTSVINPSPPKGRFLTVLCLTTVETGRQGSLEMILYSVEVPCLPQTALLSLPLSHIERE